MTEHTKMPSERALRAAEEIDAQYYNSMFLCGHIHISEVSPPTVSEIIPIISSEYAELEAYVEYVKNGIVAARKNGSAYLFTFPEWKKEQGK